MLHQRADLGQGRSTEKGILALPPASRDTPESVPWHTIAFIFFQNISSSFNI